MSIQAVAWVLEHSTTKGAQRLVLIALANHAGETGEAWPSIERLAAEANLNKEHAKRTLVDLERGGHIAKEVNAAPDQRMRGDRRTNLYTILHGGHNDAPPWLNGRENDARTGGRTTRARGGADLPPNHQLEPSIEPNPSSSPEGADPVIEALCDELANRIAHHEQSQSRPTVTTRWRKDMRLLVERGPLKRDPVDPYPPDRIMRALAVIFTRLNEPGGSPAFCWADQVRSPAALRKHLPSIALAAKRVREGAVSKGTASLDRTVERLGGGPPTREPLGMLEQAAR